MIRASLAVLACVLAAPAAALTLPPPVQRMTDDALAECRAMGGAPTLLADYARAADLNGDGADDYLVDFVGLGCEGAVSYFCGSAGCPVSVWVSTPRGYESAWSGPAQASRIDTESAPPAVVVFLHGQFCDPPRVGADGCEQRIGVVASSSAAAPEAGAGAEEEAEGWSLRAVPGDSLVAVSAAPDPIRGVALFCLSGAPFLVLTPEKPGRETLSLGFGFQGGTLAATARREPSAGDAYVIDLAEVPLAQALAGADAKTTITLDGAVLGDLSLAGSSKAIRAALASCLPL